MYNQYFIIIPIQMESIVPKCINNNPCLIVCNFKTCKANQFLCGDGQCQCHSLHQKCTTTLKWKTMKQSFSNKLKKSSSQLVAYLTQINDIYKSVIKQIEISFAQIYNISDNFGFSQLEREVYQMLKQKKFFELTGSLMNKVELELTGGKKQFQVRIIEKEKKQIEKQTTILIQMLEGLTKLNIKEDQHKTIINKSSVTSFKLDSKITQDIETLSSFFPNKKITSMKLLYRASENNFQVKKFHDKCDGKQHTITILKTEFGNVIGGYTPLSWHNNKHNNYQKDNNKQSFMFSLTNKHKLKLIEGQQGFAIYHRNDYGPVFGKGNNFWIGNKANQNSNSGVIPGETYNYNNEYVKNTQQSIKKLTGQSKGYNFKTQEWQVYQIVFA